MTNITTIRKKYSKYFKIPEYAETHIQCKTCKEWVSIEPMHDGSSVLDHHIEHCKQGVFEEVGK